MYARNTKLVYILKIYQYYITKNKGQKTYMIISIDVDIMVGIKSTLICNENYQ